ncbi:hypothetical protein AY599_28720 [Leptolyngbya valderiana BDU 20041]|nr:hypothetical protein AY599_28720 [Leptolyngbya valderiana BDU 20041]
MAELAIIAGVSTAGALALGVPLRVFGWRATWTGVRAGLGWIRRHRWWALLTLLAGAVAGLWTFDDARALLFGVFFR